MFLIKWLICSLDKIFENAYIWFLFCSIFETSGIVAYILYKSDNMELTHTVKNIPVLCQR